MAKPESTNQQGPIRDMRVDAALRRPPEPPLPVPKSEVWEGYFEADAAPRQKKKKAASDGPICAWEGDLQGSAEFDFPSAPLSPENDPLAPKPKPQPRMESAPLASPAKDPWLDPAPMPTEKLPWQPDVVTIADDRLNPDPWTSGQIPDPAPHLDGGDEPFFDMPLADEDPVAEPEPEPAKPAPIQPTAVASTVTTPRIQKKKTERTVGVGALLLVGAAGFALGSLFVQYGLPRLAPLVKPWLASLLGG